MSKATVSAVREALPRADRLPRRLGVWSAAAVLIGSTIGSGIFRVPSTVAAEVCSVGAMGLLWVVGALLAVALAAFLFADPAAGSLAAPPQFAPASWGGFGIALIAVLWAYDGWADLTSLAGEVRDPGRTLPRALIGGMAVVVAVYFAVNAAYLYVLPLEAMAGSSLVAADAATRIFGAVGASMVAALVMLLDALVEQPGSTLFGFGIILLGIPVFYGRRSLRRFAGTADREA